MRQAVIDSWHEFSIPLEGRVHHMYLDILGLVTAGVGNLADPVSLALAMPWKRLDGTRAAPHEIVDNWNRIKNLQELKSRHYNAAAPFTNIRLDDEGIDAMVMQKLVGNAAFMQATHFPDLFRWPADAQLGVSSMAWACGPDFPREFKNFRRFAADQKWLEAMAACKIREAGNPGIVPRNQANRLCFANAETVRRGGLNPEILYWPKEAPTKELEPEPVLQPRLAETFTPDPNVEAVHEARDEELKGNE